MQLCIINIKRIQLKYKYHIKLIETMNFIFENNGIMICRYLYENWKFQKNYDIDFEKKEYEKHFQNTKKYRNRSKNKYTRTKKMMK
jgi:hypothetical protein